ncbi:MAG TPA: hypothetical protein PKD96_00350 [Candidatus Absconditabacterales bacterium]|nr:hypothetical protein [Candidatus Absconditabacterales bacterium]HMT26730.1 hypothetical protein [Candidatus Absconditabacterales bacterium]
MKLQKISIQFLFKKINLSAARKCSSFILLFFFLVAGCSSTETTPTERVVSFDKFFVTVPAQFVPMNPSSVDHISLKGKIAAVLKVRGDLYDTNFIVSISSLAQPMNSREFAQILAMKLKDNLFGYRYLANDSLSFSCGEKDYQGYFHTFTVNESLLSQKKPTYYFGQYYFVDNKKGYILSFSSNVDTDLSLFEGYVSEIGCLSGSTIAFRK